MSLSRRFHMPTLAYYNKSLRRQLRSSDFSLLEQRLMWAAFTVAFFGFLRASEFTASTSESATL